VAGLGIAAADVDVRPGSEGWTDLAHALDLRAGLIVAEATLRSAIERRETRGAQIRSDFPELDPFLQANVYVDSTMTPFLEPVAAVPPELGDWLDRPVTVTAGRLLE
jgi:succinate dehydrogenase / fumarate reductase flavoprotein subunit